VGWGRERVALIKSLITGDRKSRARGVVAKFELKMSADILRSNLKKNSVQP